MKRILLMLLLSITVLGGCASIQDDGRGGSRQEKSGGYSGHRH